MGNDEAKSGDRIIRDKRERGIYQRIRDGRTSWIVRYWVGGREHRASVPTRALAVALRGKIKVETAEGTILPGERRHSRLTVAQLGQKWIDGYAKPNKRSWKCDAGCLAHLRRYLGRVNLDDSAETTVERYKHTRQAETYKRGPNDKARKTTNSTINREVPLLPSMMNFAVRSGLLASNPVARVKMLREPPGRASRITSEQEAALLAAAPPRLRSLIIPGLHTGCRVRELCALKWANVDSRGAFLTVERAKPLGERGTKGGGARLLPLNADAVEALLAMKPAAIRPTDKPDPEAFVFATAKGAPYQE